MSVWGLRPFRKRGVRNTKVLRSSLRKALRKPPFEAFLHPYPPVPSRAARTIPSFGKGQRSPFFGLRMVSRLVEGGLQGPKGGGTKREGLGARKGRASAQRGEGANPEKVGGPWGGGRNVVRERGVAIISCAFGLFIGHFV